MDSLLRIVFCSRSLSSCQSGIDPAIGGIFSQARRNNAKQQLSGVLLHGDGCFFQCLEGEHSAVESTFHKINLDPRHEDVCVLRLEKSNARIFSKWSVKLISHDDEVGQFLSGRHVSRFSPELFGEKLIDELLTFLSVASHTDDQHALQLFRQPTRPKGILERITEATGR